MCWALFQRRWRGAGEDVAVVVPRYRIAQIYGSERIWHSMAVWVGPHHFTVAIDQVIRDGVRYFFVDCPPLYDRAGIYSESGYDYLDNHLRFGLLCRATLEISRHIFRADVFHGHDWQAGLLATYLRATSPPIRRFSAPSVSRRFIISATRAISMPACCRIWGSSGPCIMPKGWSSMGA